ncbi:MAG: PLDc N-terminal domain-containing protein [Litorimonas sp.]
MGTIIGILWAIFTIWGLFNVWTSASDLLAKILWSAAMLIFNVFGVIAWYIFGPKSTAAV